jgi:hypothetical protein
MIPGLQEIDPVIVYKVNNAVFLGHTTELLKLKINTHPRSLRCPWQTFIISGEEAAHALHMNCITMPHCE